MRLIAWIARKIDNRNIRRKLVLIYIFCMMLPLLITDSVIIGVVCRAEARSAIHKMENVANALRFTFSSEINQAAQLGKGIYTSHYVDDFINTQFASDLEYFTSYHDFFDNTLINLIEGANGLKYTFYLDNDTILNGSQFQKLEKAEGTDWYRDAQEHGEARNLFFGYRDGRKIYYYQKLNFYDKQSKNILLIEIDYGTLKRVLSNIQYDDLFYLCDGERILISNAGDSSVSRDYYPLASMERIGYSENLSLYQQDLTIHIAKPLSLPVGDLLGWWPLILLLVLVNIVLPMLMVEVINRSFTVRLRELSDVFHTVDDEQLRLIENPRGSDEIGQLMSNYNRMAGRINDLIQIVYKKTIREQEMVVAEQKAELLALHSQINPHFLFNALESIRMHSVLKNEPEIADMVANLAKLQRQYTEWKDDRITVEREMEFVQAYLTLQKYRFGDRLSFDIDVDERCRRLTIPKLTIVTFVENACVHGIESKTTPGWIFVRVSEEEDILNIEIEDTGKGMSEEEAEALLSRMRNASMEMLRGSGRIGIVNACLRLKLLTNDRVAFELESEERTGTIVTIRMPIK